MLRQRVRSRSFPFARIAADAVVVLLALALVWGGAMLVLLAFKTSPATVDGLSGYRRAYDRLASLVPSDVDGSVRVVTAIGGLAACLIFGYLALRSIPRPYLARVDLRLSSDDLGVVEVDARAIERAAELAALQHPAVSSVQARYATDGLALDVGAMRAEALSDTLEDLQRRARESLARHELPPLPVNITLVHLERENRRELQ